MKKALLFGVLLGLSISLYNPNLVNAIPFGSNLITNGNAEDGLGSSTGFTVVPVPGWATTGNFTVVPYDISGGFPTTAGPGPSDQGLNFFAGGPSNASSSAAQVIDISSSALLIDTGSVSFDLSGYFGGWFTQSDNAVLTASFLDTGGSTLGGFSVGAVTPGDRGNTTGLLFRSTSGFVPTGARTIGLDLQMTRLQGSYNDGYADNLSLIFTDPSTSPAPVPEPSTLLLLGSGLVGLIVFGKKRHSRDLR